VHPSSPPPHQETSASFVISTETEEAPVMLHRKTRAPKVIAADITVELRNREMIDHSNNYIENMLHAEKEHLMRGLPHQAKKNAEHYILGRGINGIGSTIDSGMPHPLAMFSGERLFEWVTGKPLPVAGTKREREEGPDSASRQVRPRDEYYEFGRNALHDDQGMTIMEGVDIELPREHVADLEDISSAMPWNISASNRGSSVPRMGSAAPPSSAARRSRMVSASPTHGHSGVAPLLIDEDAFRMIEDFNEPLGENGLPLTSSPGPQTISNKIDISLDTESSNFLTFVKYAILGKQSDADQIAGQLGAEAEMVESVTFGELLPPRSNSKVVAANGLLHVLALATKNLIKVKQDEHFGSISISTV
jgi:meiotic recombination protein REC8, fungi type